METALLSPSTATPNPASRQGASVTDSKGSSDFSPAMDEAVSSLEKDTRNTSDSPMDDSSFSTEETSTSSTPEETAIASSEETLSDETAIASSESFLSALGIMNNKSQSIVAGQVLQSFTTEALATWIAAQDSTSPIIQAGIENNPAAATKAETLLLQQIQNILDQGKNNGSITVTGSNVADPQKSAENLQNLSSALLAETENSDIQARQIGVIAVPVKETVHTTQSSTKLEGAHQDVNEQFYNAKLGESKTNNGNDFQQRNNEQKGSEQQTKPEVQNTVSQTTGNTTPEGKPLESTFGQQLSSSSTTTSTPTSIEGKFTPGSHHPVPEREMVNNLIQRFNVNPRLQTSKLTMQLHPAELGALKIDILVKGDSIKANIVAQSQQVLETLDKQMPRLRAVLQEQGFTVDSFKISLESDGGNQKGLFQEHFSSQQQEFTSNRSPAASNESFDILLDSQKDLDEADEDSSGVNLTV